MRDSVKRKLNNSGAAMVVSIIIIAVLMIFAFSLILISYNLYASQNKNLAGMRNMEAANTLSVALDKEITDDKAWLDSNLWQYIRCNVFDLEDPSSWPYYDPETDGHGKEEAIKVFALDFNADIEGMPSETKVKIYWTLPDEFSLSAYQVSNDIDQRDMKNGARLYIEIQCNTASQAFKITDTYKLRVEEMQLEDTENHMMLGQLKNNVKCNPDGNDINDNEKWTWSHEDRQ